VLDEIERIELQMKANLAQQVRGNNGIEPFRSAEAMGDGRSEIVRMRPSSAPQAEVTGEGLAPAQPFASDSVPAVAARIRDIVTKMQERGLAAATCYQIETLAAMIIAAPTLHDPTNGRARRLGVVLHELERYLAAMLAADASAPQPEATVPTPPPAIEPLSLSARPTNDKDSPKSTPALTQQTAEEVDKKPASIEIDLGPFAAALSAEPKTWPDATPGSPINGRALVPIATPSREPPKQSPKPDWVVPTPEVRPLFRMASPISASGGLTIPTARKETKQLGAVAQPPPRLRLGSPTVPSTSFASGENRPVATVVPTLHSRVADIDLELFASALAGPEPARIEQAPLHTARPTLEADIPPAETLPIAAASTDAQLPAAGSALTEPVEPARAPTVAAPFMPMVVPPRPTALPGPHAAAPRDPLGALNALSEEERIALFT
jgi:hypothetical protein